MTTEERRRIAKWCGWRWVRGEPVSGTVAAWMTDGSRSENVTEDGRPWGGQFVERPEPHDVIRDSTLLHYDTDLNACRKFEEVADRNGLLTSYLHALHKVKFPEPMHYAQALWMATPAQRCEAILKVIREA